MRIHWRYVTTALLLAMWFCPIGCERQHSNSGAPPEIENGNQASAPEIHPTNTGGNGNAATTTGAGATNGVSGNETPGAEKTIANTRDNSDRQ